MRRVLIVEDDEAQAAGTMRLLRGEGITSILATSLAEGLARDRSTEFDCVILDAGLPDISSPYDAVEHIRDFRAPIVVCTGSDDRDLARAVRETGASFVVKPGGDVLVEKVWSQINYRRAAADSAEGQMEAQKRLQDPVLKESTPVTLSLARVLIIVITLIGSAVSITSLVLTKVGLVDANISSIRADLSAYTTLANKRQDTLEASLKEQSEATQRRILEWTKWRWGVSRDLKNTGEKLNIPVITKEE